MSADPAPPVQPGRDGCVMGEGYSPRYLATKHRISRAQARDLIAEVGNDRERLNLVAAVVRRANGR